MKSSSQKKRYDEAFKRQAVQNWINSGKTGEAVARELGIYANLLYMWKKRYFPELDQPEPPPKAGSMEELQGQLDAARRELAHVREQRDILKKTLGILSEPLSNATNGLKR